MLSCSSDFDATRHAPPRGSLGRELWTLVCDRVGAQSLREDVTGASFHAVCHADTSGGFADRVDVSKLPALPPAAVDTSGHSVPLETRQQRRGYSVARVEAMARRRLDLIGAFDATFPDVELLLREVTPESPVTGCDTPPTAEQKKAALLRQIADTFGRFVDLYNDGTIPELTRGLGRFMRSMEADPEARDALARLDARQGYRPLQLALGIVRPALGYDRLYELANSVLKLVATDSDPFNPAHKTDPANPSIYRNHTPVPGPASGELGNLLATLREELRTPADPPLDPLVASTDTTLDAPVISRPRTKLEITGQILLAGDDRLIDGPPHLVVLRDPRGVAQVPLVGGAVPPPFVDATGSGVPDLDPLGQFVTLDGTPLPAPFFAVGAADGLRDDLGRATLAPGQPLYGYLDVSRSFVRSMLRDLRTLLDTDPAAAEPEIAVKLLAGLYVLFGERDAEPTSQKTYPPDPLRADDFTLAGQPAPPDLATAPVTLPYRAFHADTSPIVDLEYALGQTLAHPAMDDALALLEKLLAEQPAFFARIVGLGLRLDAIADAHPEAKIPGPSTLWDEMLDAFAIMAQKPKLFDDMIRAFGDERTPKLASVFAAYMKYKDEITYYRDVSEPANQYELNGPAWNLTAQSFDSLVTPVDRTQPDTGNNRSALQRFLQLLHDAKGLAACTKDGAVVHLDIEWPAGSGLRILLNYPTDVLVQAVCAFVGGAIPKNPMPLCGILRFDDMAKLIVDVALERAQFDVRDTCLLNLMNSPLTGLVGGADAFLEGVSGIKGFTLHPTVNAVARMGFFDTPYSAWGGYAGTDYYPKTRDFLKDIIDPVPTMVCPEKPYTDPTDGKLIPLRQCASFGDTLRGRDHDALFPLEQLGFVESIRPLAAAFADNDASPQFVQLFDVLHLHWGSPAQTEDECDPALPTSDARWCPQDGAVSYEPLMAELVEGTDLFQVLFDAVPILQATRVEHCDAWDAATHACTATSEKDGVAVLAEAARVLLDPFRNVGLTDRHGSQTVVRNDGNTNPQVTRIYLLIDALKAMDAAFERWAAANPDDDRLPGWRQARSHLVDLLFSVDTVNGSNQFRNPATGGLLQRLVSVLRGQIRAHCPDRSPGADCPWARTELADNVAELVGGPLTPAIFDVLEAVRKDEPARREVLRLLAYLIGSADNDADQTTVAAAADLIQVLRDDANLTPIYRVASTVHSPEIRDASGAVARRGLLHALVEVLTRLFARGYDAQGAPLCTGVVDPNRAIAVLLKGLVTPKSATEPAAIETIWSVIADVNRADPTSAAKFDAADYANLDHEVGDFFLDKATGLEQVYEVIRAATLR